MIGLIATMLLIQIPQLAEIHVDPVRFEAEQAADADVIASLKRNHDRENVIRPVDVRFVGREPDLKELAQALSGSGWKVIQILPMEDGLYALDTLHEQTTEADSLRELTETCLRIETAFNVRYDGWGTVAETGNQN